MSRPFIFDIQKTTEAVAYLLKLHPHRCMNYMRLLKILYIAEREILQEAGVPLTGSKVVAMKRGPVLEEVYALIKGQSSAATHWSKFFKVHDYHLELYGEPGRDRLSKYVAKKLEDVAKRFVAYDEWDMVEYTHTLPEWKKNDPGESSKQISLRDILAAVGREDDFQQIVNRANESVVAAEAFAN